MPCGYTGKILVVNLTEQTFNIEHLEDEIYRQFYGGYGLGVYYIYNNIEPGCDPLGSGNILGFLPGLLTSSPAPLSGRYVVCGKSPLTGQGIRTNGDKCNGGWGNANSGGYFGNAIKRAGFDGIFFKGIAENPVYLSIDDKGISIQDANDLWGKDTIETESTLKEKHGKQFEVSSIGPAGENLILFSGIVTDSGRIAARSGLGAVMGSKKLKAICIKGKEKIDFANRERMTELSRQYNRRIKRYQNLKIITKNVHMIDRLANIIRLTHIDTRGGNGFWSRMVTAAFGGALLGTTTITVLSSQNGDTPIKNFAGVGYKDFAMKKALKIRGKNLRPYIEKQYGCYACSVRCGAILKLDNLPYKEKHTHRPEYESCSAFGPMILNDNLETIIHINEYLNRSGMDSLSAGNVVAFTCECVEKGLLSKDNFCCSEYPEGFLPTFGDHSTIIPLLKLIETREGIGDILANGTKKAAERINGSSEFAVTANGQELPQHDSRYDPGLGLTYITDPTPGRHSAGTIGHEQSLGVNSLIKEIKFENSHKAYKRGKHSVKVVKFHQTIEALGFCLFIVHFGRYPYFEMISAAFGWEITPEELLQTGHRIQTLRQMFNAREGAIRHEINQRAIGSPPLKKGPLKNVSLDLDTMVKGYYEEIGFEENGIPKKETLKELKLDFCIKDLDICTGAPKPPINNYIQEKKKKPYHFSIKF